jgi:hypothetical protein
LLRNVVWWAIIALMMEAASTSEKSVTFYQTTRLSASIIRAIALIMEAANMSETSVTFYQTTRRNNAEDSHLHTAAVRT